MTTFNTNNGLGGTQQNMTTTFKTLVDILATTGALKRIFLQEAFVGPGDVPNTTDCEIVWDISKVTAEGTATTVTPNPNTDFETGTQVGCSGTSKANHTAEPTITSNSSRVRRAMNQRSSMRWVALRDSDILIAPGVAAAGWALRALSSTYASKLNGELVFGE